MTQLGRLARLLLNALFGQLRFGRPYAVGADGQPFLVDVNTIDRTPSPILFVCAPRPNRSQC